MEYDQELSAVWSARLLHPPPPTPPTIPESLAMGFTITIWMDVGFILVLHRLWRKASLWPLWLHKGPLWPHKGYCTAVEKGVTVATLDPQRVTLATLAPQGVTLATLAPQGVLHSCGERCHFGHFGSSRGHFGSTRGAA